MLYWIYKDFDFAQVRNIIYNEMNLWWFALSIVFGIMSHVIRGWRWRITLAPLGYSPHTSNCIYAIFIAYAANLIIPRIGEVSRCAVLDKCDKIPFVQSLGTVVAERLIDTLTVLSLTIVAITLQWNIFYTFFASTGNTTENNHQYSSVSSIAFIIVSIASICILGYFILKKMALLTKIKSVLHRFWEGITVLGRMKNLKLFIAETIGIWFCYFMQFYLCFFCFSFSCDLSVSAGLLLFVAGSIAVVVPTPNGAGPWHFAIISMMILYGISQNDAGMFAIIVHSSQTALVALLGIIGAIMINHQKKHNV